MLVPHVALLGLLRFREVLVDVLDIYELPQQVIAIANTLKPCVLVGEPVTLWMYRIDCSMMESA